MGKAEIRARVLALLEAAGAARFPGARGRIPNFPGAERAARRLGDLPAWRAARTLKVNPDAPQRAVRRLALEQGKRVYMAVPRLRERRPFWLLDPRRLRAGFREAASIAGAARHGRRAALDEVEPLDLIVCGSVAVGRDGARVGKGGGYSDLEFALLVREGKIGPAAPIVTTVHPLQVLDEPLEMTTHDIAVDVIVLPEETLEVPRRYPRPAGIFWELLPPDTIEAIPVLRALRARGRGGAEGKP